jgi:tripartite-type tricarboxylate transporter receptor subunit TctC
MLTRRNFLSTGVAVAALAIPSVTRAMGQTYPTRLIKIVLPSPPGGASELVIRPIAERLLSVLGQPVVIENRPGGAGGTLGVRSVASADPDGYTLVMPGPGALVVAPVLYKNLGYDPAKDLAPIATLFSSPQMLAVNPVLPVTSLKELIAYAKSNPGKVSFASPGYGTQPHLLGEMLRLNAGIDIIHVPYKGPTQPITDLLGGQVQMIFENIPNLLPHVQSGRLRALAIADESRSPQLPDVPTTIEGGLPKLQATFWSGVLAPGGTPAAIISKLNSALNEEMRSKEIDAVLAKLSAKPKIGSPSDFARFMAAETRKWSEVVKAAGIRVE